MSATELRALSGPGLPPCPFCGVTQGTTEQRGELEFPILRVAGFYGSFSVSCYACRYDGPPSATIDGAVRLWSQRIRPAEDAVVEQIAEYVENYAIADVTRDVVLCELATYIRRGLWKGGK